MSFESIHVFTKSKPQTENPDFFLFKPRLSSNIIKYDDVCSRRRHQQHRWHQYLQCHIHERLGRFIQVFPNQILHETSVITDILRISIVLSIHPCAF